MKAKVTAKVISQSSPAPGIYDLRLRTDLARQAKSGQFVMVYPEDRSTLLPRPISVCEADAEKEELRLVYRVAGAGTAEFSKLKEGDFVRVLGVLGNGYAPSLFEGKKVLLLGGGIGIPPMLELAKELSAKSEVLAILGYRDANLFLREDLENYAKVLIATEDGSVGTKGNVLDALRESGETVDAICACGPLPMLRAIKACALERDIPAYLSLEERMACGVGACLGCVTKTEGMDAHSHVKNARVCTDGPVFEARSISI